MSISFTNSSFMFWKSCNLFTRFWFCYSLPPWASSRSFLRLSMTLVWLDNSFSWFSFVLSPKAVPMTTQLLQSLLIMKLFHTNLWTPIAIINCLSAWPSIQLREKQNFGQTAVGRVFAPMLVVSLCLCFCYGLSSKLSAVVNDCSVVGQRCTEEVFVLHALQSQVRI